MAGLALEAIREQKLGLAKHLKKNDALKAMDRRSNLSTGRCADVHVGSAGNESAINREDSGHFQWTFTRNLRVLTDLNKAAA